MEPDATERQEKPAKSKWRGIIIGVCIALIVVYWFAWLRTYAMERAMRQKCLSNLYALGSACKMYEMDHPGQFPTNWFCFKDYYSNPCLLRCPSRPERYGTLANVDTWSDYILVPNLTTNDPPKTILAYEPLRNHKEGGNVLYLDGSVYWLSAEEYGKLKAKTGKVLSGE